MVTQRQISGYGYLLFVTTLMVSVSPKTGHCEQDCGFSEYAWVFLATSDRLNLHDELSGHEHQIGSVEQILENDLDIELQRFLPQIAGTDVLRSKGGGLLRGLSR